MKKFRKPKILRRLQDIAERAIFQALSRIIKMLDEIE